MNSRTAALVASGVAAAVLAALAGAEWLARAATQEEPARLAGLYVPDDTLGYALAPGFCGRDVQPDGDFDVEVCVDGDGHRRTVVPADAEGRPILLLGGGFVFGTGVADAETAASRLSAALGRPVVNAGIEPSDLPTARARLDALLAKGLDPSAVVFSVDLGSDLLRPGEKSARERLGVHDGRLVPREDLDADGSLRFDPWLRTFWRSYDGVRRRLERPGPEERMRRERRRLGLLGADAAGQRRRLASALRAMIVRVLETRRPTFVAALLVPTRFQVDAAYRERICAERDICVGDAEARRSLDDARRESRRLSLPMVDMAEAIEQAGGAGDARFYFAHDRHWTPESHDLAAQSIVRLVRFIESVQRRNRAAGRTLPSRKSAPPGK